MDKTILTDATIAGEGTGCGIQVSRAMGQSVEIGGFYSRDKIMEVMKEIGEDCDTLSDTQLAECATQKLTIRVIHLEGFVGLVFLVRKKKGVRGDRYPLRKRA